MAETGGLGYIQPFGAKIGESLLPLENRPGSHAQSDRLNTPLRLPNMNPCRNIAVPRGSRSLRCHWQNKRLVYTPFDRTGMGSLLARCSCWDYHCHISCRILASTSVVDIQWHHHYLPEGKPQLQRVREGRRGECRDEMRT